MIIEPNKWYTLDELFGSNLVAIHFYRDAKHKSELGERVLGIFSAEKLMENLSATFSGIKLKMEFDNVNFSPDSPNQSRTGKRIYYPLEQATGSELDRKNYGNLRFKLDGIPDTDLIGQPIFDKEGYPEWNYKYKMLIRSLNGIFISEDKAYSPSKELAFPQGRLLYFKNWKPNGSDETGLIYVPLFSHKLSPLEIMLQEK